MISRIRAKRLVAQLLLLAGLAVALGTLVLVGRFVLQSSTGADSASALHDVATLPADAQHLVSWEQDAWLRERQLEPANRALIEAAYIRAWAALGHYQTTGDTDALTDTFSSRARSTVLAMPRNERLATWDLGHRLTLQFYSLDGGTVAFSDGDASLARTIRTGADSERESVLLSHETYDVVMALVDGYWRIDQLRRGPDTDLTTVTTTDDRTQVTGSAPRAPVDVPTFRATEYRPDWDVLDPSQVEATAAIAASLADPTVPVETTPAALPTAPPMADTFATLRSLGVTAVRVPLDYEALGGPDPTPARLAAVSDVLDTAAANDLGVVFVLFDGVTDLSPGSWAGADRQLQEVVLAVRDSPALLGWDLADQPEDRTAEGATPTEIRAFLVNEATRLHGLDPATPMTISWKNAAAAADPAMVGLVDYVSLHVDGLDAEARAAALSTVSAAADERPVALVDAGPASDGGWGPFPRTESRQASTVADLLGGGADRFSLAAAADSLGTGQRGLIRTDGSLKPAALLLGAGADLSVVPAPGLTDLIRGRFWQALVVFLVLLLPAGWWLRRRRRRSRGRHASPDPDDGPGTGRRWGRVRRGVSGAVALPRRAVSAVTRRLSRSGRVSGGESGEHSGGASGRDSQPGTISGSGRGSSSGQGSTPDPDPGSGSRDRESRPGE